MKTGKLMGGKFSQRCKVIIDSTETTKDKNSRVKQRAALKLNAGHILDSLPEKKKTTTSNHTNKQKRSQICKQGGNSGEIKTTTDEASVTSQGKQIPVTRKLTCSCENGKHQVHKKEKPERTMNHKSLGTECSGKQDDSTSQNPILKQIWG